MPVYVISLDRSAERFSLFLERNRHLSDIMRAQAVDGADLDRGDLVARGIVSPDLSYTDAALGCAVSHACVWQIASGMDVSLTIAEDDGVFRHDFAVAARGMVAALPQDWDLVLWGWNFNSLLCVDLLPGVSPCVLVCDQIGLRENVERFQGSIVPATPFRLLRAHGSVAYSISPGGANKLLRLCLPLRPDDVPFPIVNKLTRNDGIDMMMSLAYPQMQAFVSLPPLVATENRPEVSTIKGKS
jgi:GR25 family glycosyltransferase involved in LPS biosynthesis